jgi:hypothetical protein
MSHRMTTFLTAVLLTLLAGPGHFARAQDLPPGMATRAYGGTEAGTMLGRGVLDSEDTDVGALTDILVDKDGRPVAGIVDLGGFLGVGMRRVAIAWRLLRFVHDGGETLIHMNLKLDDAAAAPEFHGPDNTVIVIDRASQ